MKRYIQLNEDSTTSEKDFLIDLAEYVGANEEFQLKKYEQYIKPFIKNYTVYRFWQDITLSDLPKKLPHKEYYATSKSMNAIKEILKETFYVDDGIVTKHVGKGIDIIYVLKKTLSEVELSNDLFRDKEFVKDVIRTNSYQEEIVFLTHIAKLEEKDVLFVIKDNELLKK